jgi:hypothetical protein
MDSIWDVENISSMRSLPALPADRHFHSRKKGEKNRSQEVLGLAFEAKRPFPEAESARKLLVKIEATK